MTKIVKLPDVGADFPCAEQKSLSLTCPFLSCDGQLRVFDGGRPWQFPHLDSCKHCGCRVARPPDREAIKKLIDEHLL